MSGTIFSITAILLTIIIFVGFRRLYLRFPLPFLIPTLTSTIVIIIILSYKHISYHTYMTGGQWINDLLGPAVVALAYPLYKQREVVRKNFLPVILGILSGVIIGMVSGLLLGEIFGFSKDLLLAVLPKSVTTPVAMQITTGLGGDASTTIVFTMISGFTGVILGPSILKLFKIDSDMGRGIALGTASHGVGTSKANEFGGHAVSFSSAAMTLSAIIGTVIAPIIVSIFFK
jgi:predicted murein hydrolase (TIGR00659 family)